MARYRLEPRSWQSHRPLSRRSIVACAALLAPMGVGVEIPSDSLDTTGVEVSEPPQRVTRLTLGGGTGGFGRTVDASRVITLGYSDCTGEPVTETVTGEFKTKQDYTDIGGELATQVNDRLHVGVRGGWVEETATYLGSTIDPVVIDSLFRSTDVTKTESYIYVSPFFSVEDRTLGWGVGFIASDGRLWTGKTREYGEHNDPTIYPTGHLRLGRLDRIYLNAAYFESVPVYSGGGVFTVGFGGRPAPPLDLWLGMTTGGPYAEEGLLMRASVDLGRNVTLGANYRVSTTTDADYAPSTSESGGSVNLTFKLYRE